MEDSLKETEKIMSRGDKRGAIVLVIIGVFIMVGGIVLHIVLSPIGGQNVGLATVPMIALGLAIVMWSLIYLNRKRLKLIGCYCIVFFILSHMLSFLLLSFLSR
ncbi:MAG: hypothetical protein ACFFD7_07200 [Candidatus Thorarchaeota archaeon]